MKKSTITKASFYSGLFIFGFLSAFLYSRFTLSDTNQKILPKSYTIVCGYWNKNGVLEIVKED